MKRKYIVEHWWVVDDVEGILSEEKRGTYSTYAESEAKAISNVRYRLGISLCPYDVGCDRAGWNELRVVS